MEKEADVIHPIGEHCQPFQSNSKRKSRDFTVHVCGKSTPTKFRWFCGIDTVGAVVYVLLVFSARGAKWLTPAVLKLSFKLSGLILAALAVQMIVSGLRCSDLKILKSIEEVAHETRMGK